MDFVGSKMFSQSLTQAKRLMCRRIGVQFEEPVTNPADLLSFYADCFKRSPLHLPDRRPDTAFNSCHWGGNFLVWNVRGLNSPARRAAVSVFVSHNDVCMICLQETKMSVFDLNLVKEICGASFSGFAYSPSDGASGGLLIAWADDVVVSSIQCSKIFNSAM
uniref:Endonuclease/exonuclease/phosphatase domain-containing protein n=1 Tax=Triticum urartu TaxID=4572 RepID=A0A8R7U2Y7_TRIUA